MINSAEERIFDTMVDTNKLYVSMKTYFTIRPTKGDPEKALVYLFISGDRKRERLFTEMKIPTIDWDKTNQRLFSNSKENQDLNLILDNINSKITTAKILFRLSERSLTPAILKKELTSNMPRVKFTSFFELKLEEEKVMMCAGSYERYKSLWRKLVLFDNEITFIDIDENWLDKFRKHHKKIGNLDTTISGNVAGIKKFLGLAVKDGIKLRIDLKTIDVGSTKGNRTSLMPFELKKCLNYYFSEYINESNQLVLGYFLFSCMTGLRISDVQKLTRSNFLDNFITFVNTKTDIDQSISMNLTVRKIVNHFPLLFEKKFADQTINDELKKIMKLLTINKKVSFHVARHTFATSFLRAGGQVEKLQKLLGHSDIKQTMIYVHIVQADANKEIFLLDDLFN
ncbi:MAG: site-specific integrase [Flavobacterium sp.]|nr:site-specific integrase [Flavobacterium sp.]